MGGARQAGVVCAVLVAAVTSSVSADGVVQSYRIDAHGRVSGLILRDGTEISAHASQGDQFVERIALGDRVRLADGPESTLRVRDARTGATVVVSPRAPYVDPLANATGGGPRDPTAREAIDDARAMPYVRVGGSIATILHTRAGMRSGFVMDDGTQVHVLARVAGALAELHPGDRVTVEGRGTHGPYGLGLWAVAIRRGDGTSLLDMQRGVAAPELRMRPGERARQ